MPKLNKSKNRGNENQKVETETHREVWGKDRGQRMQQKEEIKTYRREISRKKIRKQGLTLTKNRIAGYYTYYFGPLV